MAIRSLERGLGHILPQSLQSLQKDPTCPQLDFRLVTSRTVTESIPVCFKHSPTPTLVCGSPRTFAHQHASLGPSCLIFKMGKGVVRTQRDGNWTRRRYNKLFLLLESDSWLSSEWLQLVNNF